MEGVLNFPPGVKQADTVTFLCAVAIGPKSYNGHVPFFAGYLEIKPQREFRTVSANSVQ